MRYQIYFRTSRGGIGIPYELAKTEFLTVFHRFELEIEREWWAKHRMWIELSLPPDEIAAIASDLGYTEAVLHLRSEPYRDEIIRPIGRVSDAAWTPDRFLRHRRKLVPGLSALGPESFCIADARSLPLHTGRFDLIVTEPPFRTSYRQAVMVSLSELHRVLKPGGRLILLIANDMHQGVQTSFERMGSNVELIGIIPRGGGMKCPVLEITLPQ